MKILITGGYGFFGFHLAKALSNHDCQITLLDIKSSSEFDNDFKELIKKDNISYLQLDLLNNNLEKFLDKDYSHIIHLAALLGVQNVLENPFIVLSLNLQMLFNIISFLNHLDNEPTLLFASTSEVYAGTLLAGALKFPTEENSQLILPDLKLPRTSYMLSKIYGEAICHSCNFKTIILRPHNLYGPRMGMKHVVPQLIKRIHNTPINGSLGVYSPTHKRTFCYIDDAVKQVYELITSKNIEKNIFNLGTEKPEITMRNLASKLIKTMAREDIIINELENTPGSPERRCPSTYKLDKMTLINKRTVLEKGLKKTFDWYYKNKNIYLN